MSIFRIPSTAEVWIHVVCAGIHMSDIPSFPYALLWGERWVRPVANLTRADGEDFLRQAAHGEVATTVAPYALEAANEALDDLRAGRIDGAAVLVPPMVPRSRTSPLVRRKTCEPPGTAITPVICPVLPMALALGPPVSRRPPVQQCSSIHQAWRRPAGGRHVCGPERLRSACAPARATTGRHGRGWS
jgi:hypothetical protein